MNIDDGGGADGDSGSNSGGDGGAGGGGGNGEVGWWQCTILAINIKTVGVYLLTRSGQRTYQNASNI